MLELRARRGLLLRYPPFSASGSANSECPILAMKRSAIGPAQSGRAMSSKGTA
jgi:hypothetical protein